MVSNRIAARSWWRGSALVAVLALGPMAAACSDSSDPSPTVEGKWVGTYGSGEESTGFDFTIILWDGDSLGVIDGLGDTPEAKGTWSLSGDVVQGTYTYDAGGATYSVEATVNPERTNMEGTWGEGAAVSGAGRFVLDKE